MVFGDFDIIDSDGVAHELVYGQGDTAERGGAVVVVPGGNG